MQNRIANGAPSNRQIRNLQNGRVQLNNFVQRNNAAVLGRAIAGTDELPTVIAITRGGAGVAHRRNGNGNSTRTHPEDLSQIGSERLVLPEKKSSRVFEREPSARAPLLFLSFYERE